MSLPAGSRICCVCAGISQHPPLPCGQDHRWVQPTECDERSILDETVESRGILSLSNETTPAYPLIPTAHNIKTSIMSTKPTVLIFHGSWHQPVHYQKLVKGLEGAGFETLIPLLPSFNAQPHIGVAKDTEYLRRVLEDLLAKGKQVLILGHSYGGMMCADVVLPIHTLRCRSLAGFPGGVIGTIYLAGWLLLPGESLASALSGGILPPFIPIDVSSFALCESDIGTEGVFRPQGKAPSPTHETGSITISPMQKQQKPSHCSDQAPPSHSWSPSPTPRTSTHQPCSSISRTMEQ